MGVGAAVVEVERTRSTIAKMGVKFVRTIFLEEREKETDAEKEDSDPKALIWWVFGI